MNLTTSRRNPLLSAFSLVKRSSFLRTSLGRRLFKSAYFLYKRNIEDDLEDMVLSFPALVGGGDVLDIGANIGYTAAVLARATKSGRKVYAFEPEPFNFSEFCSRPRFSPSSEAKLSRCNWQKSGAGSDQTIGPVDQRSSPCRSQGRHRAVSF